MRQWRTIAIPFAGGIDTKTDAKQVAPTRLVELENGVFTKRGSIRKRHGYEVIAAEDSDGNDPQGEAVATHGDALVLLGKKRLYTFNETKKTWHSQGYLNHVSIEVADVERGGVSQTRGESASANGITVRAFEEDGGIKVVVLDSASGALITSLSGGTNLGAGEKPRVLRVGAFVHVLFSIAANTDLMSLPVNPWKAKSLADSDTIIVAGDLHADGVFDAVPTSNNGDAIIAWYSTASNTLRMGKLQQGGSLALTRDVTETNPIDAISVAVNSLVGVVAYQRSTSAAFRYAAVTDINGLPIVGTATTLSAATYTKISAGLTESGSLVFAYQNNAATAWENQVAFLFRSIDSTGAVSGSASFTQKRADLASQFFASGGHHYLWERYESPTGLQSCYLLYCIEAGTSTPKLVGQVAVGEATPVDSDHHLPRFTANGDDVQGLLPTRKQVQGALHADSFLHDGLSEVSLVTENAVYNTAEAGKGLYVAGGILWHFDGKAPVEHNFALYPELEVDYGSSDPADHDAVAVASGSMGAGTYGYKVFYEWPTANNEIMRSTAVTFSVLISASQQVTLTIPTLTHTHKQGERSPVSIVVYRTTANGLIYHRASSEDPTSTGDNSWIENDPTANEVSWTDDLTDAALVLNEQDPNAGGVLDNVATPAHTMMVQVDRRLFFAGGAIPPNRAAYTKLRIDGDPVEYFDGLDVELPDHGGPQRALGNISETLVLFKERAIYAVAGDGPDNTGQNGQYFEPARISSDVGCLDARALCEFPDGYIFWSHKGAWLIDKGFQVSYIGADVERFNAQSIVSVSRVPDQNLIIFLSDTGTTLAYDYEHKQWTTFSAHQGISATVWGERYAYLRSDGTVMLQSTDRYDDAGVAYRLRLRTGPLRFAGLQEWWRCKRIYLLGEYFSEHSLRMDVWFNREGAPRESVTFEPSDFVDDSTWGDDATWGASEVWGGDVDSRDYQVSYAPETQKAQSISLEFTELPGAEPGRSFELAELAMLWAPMQGLGRLADARRK